MTEESILFFDPERDLRLERVVDIPPELIWDAWTKADLLKQWFCPKPWTVSECEIDLRPGGRFSTTMRSPDGQDMPNEGCYLIVESGKRLVFTDAMSAGYRPTERPFMTAVISLEPSGAGTKYTAIAKHRDSATRE